MTTHILAYQPQLMLHIQLWSNNNECSFSHNWCFIYSCEATTTSVLLGHLARSIITVEYLQKCARTAKHHHTLVVMPVLRCDQSIESVVDVIESSAGIWHVLNQMSSKPSSGIICTSWSQLFSVPRHYEVWHGHSQRRVHWSTMPRWNKQLAGMFNIHTASSC